MREKLRNQTLTVSGAYIEKVANFHGCLGAVTFGLVAWLISSGLNSPYRTSYQDVNQDGREDIVVRSWMPSFIGGEDIFYQMEDGSYQTIDQIRDSTGEVLRATRDSILQKYEVK